MAQPHQLSEDVPQVAGKVGI